MLEIGRIIIDRQQQINAIARKTKHGDKALSKSFSRTAPRSFVGIF